VYLVNTKLASLISQRIEIFSNSAIVYKIATFLKSMLEIIFFVGQKNIVDFGVMLLTSIFFVLDHPTSIESDSCFHRNV